MSFLELAARRVSVRGYRPDPVPDDLLAKVLEAGRLAPSAANRQPWRFVVVRDRAARHALKPAYPRDWFVDAPVVIVVGVDTGAAWSRADGKSYADVDGAIAMDHMTLCAADLGLGTCWIGAFDAAVVRRALNLPGGVDPLAMTPLGYAADAGRPKSRRPIAELVHYDRW